MSKPTYEELESALKELRRRAFSARRNSHNCGPFQYSDLCEEIIDMTELVKGGSPMTALNKQALRNLALRATPGPWTMEHENIWYYENGYTKHLAYFCQGDDVDDSQDDANTRYVAAADPATVLALLDELEAAEKLNAELMEKQRLIDICQGQGLEHRIAAEKRAEAAEKRIAELQARLETADKLQDSAFRHGLQHGFSLGQTDNQAGFEECLSAYRARGKDNG